MRLLALLFFFSCCSLSLCGQESIQVHISEKNTGENLEGVALLNNQGILLGKTNASGIAQIKIGDYPIFISKKGYLTRYAYSKEALQHIVLYRMGGKIPEVTIQDGLKNENRLLALRDQNRQHFIQKDTTIYYRFKYHLEVINKDWEEAAEGVIAMHYKAIGPSASYFNPYRYASFTQFNYVGSQAKELLPSVKIMPLILILGSDWMSGYGYPLWDKLTGSFLPEFRRDWFTDHDDQGNLVFSGYGEGALDRLLEELIFDAKQNLNEVLLYTPEQIQSVGSLDIFSNFMKENGISSFRSSYRYTDNENNRLLESVNHLSTFYEQNKLYYKMTFRVDLEDTIPEKTCEVPVFYLAYSPFYPGTNGWGINKLIEGGYNIERDHWLKKKDKEYLKYQKEVEKMRQMQLQEAEEEDRSTKQP